MDLGLTGKRAFVLGGSMGIGLNVARTLLLEGADVAIGARDAEVLNASSRALEREGGRDVPVVRCDAAQPHNLEAAFHAARNALGGLEILVSCVGGYRYSDARRLDVIALRRLLEAKLIGNVTAVQAAVREFDASVGGRIVLLAGTSARCPGIPHAGAVNSALVNMAKNFADELGPNGILVNTVSPGYVETDHLGRVFDSRATFEGRDVAEVREEARRSTPVGELGDAQSVADVVVFLASWRNRWITGTDVVVDGGRSRAVF